MTRIFKSKRLGFRIHGAYFQKHNGNVDANGTPTYNDANDWEAFGGRWPCELLATSGGEVLRGRQVQAETSHVAFGEYFGSQNVKPHMRAIIGGEVYGITAVLNTDGLDRETRIEMKREF